MPQGREDARGDLRLQLSGPPPATPNPVCTLCRSADVEVAYRRVLPLAGLGDNEVRFGVCGACGYLGQAPAPTAELLRAYYEGFSPYVWPPGRLPSAPAGPCARLLALARQLRPGGGRVYEVGCATGNNLWYFRNDGWEVGGCEPSPEAVELARVSHGIDVTLGWAEEVLGGLSPRPDVILFSHVIEHLRAPVEVLRLAREALAPGGLVLFEVPCAFDPETLPSGWLTLEHISFLQPETALVMLRAAGLEAVEVRVTPRHVSGQLYPVMTVAASLSDTPARPGHAAAGGRALLMAYLRRDEALWEATDRVLAGIDRPVVVWSAGVRTAQLMAHTRLLERPGVAALVDSDPRKWGLRQAGLEISSPEAFFAREDHADHTIVIGSLWSEAYIHAALRARGVPEARILRIYEGHIG